MSKASVSVIIVNYFSFSHVEKLIAQLKQNPTVLEIIVVDNSVNSDEANLLKKLSQIVSITVIPAEKNLGFAKGCNIGADSAKGKYLAFINPDVSLPSKALAQLLDDYHKEKADIIAPVIINKYAHLEYTAGYFPKITLKFWHWLLLVPHHIKIIPKESLRVDWVTGAFMLMKKELFIELGTFNAGYFMYYEDLDLCMKAYRSKKNIVYTPYVKIIHNAHSSVTLVKNKIKKNWYTASKRTFNTTYRGVLLSYIHELLYK